MQSERIDRVRALFAEAWPRLRDFVRTRPRGQWLALSAVLLMMMIPHLILRPIARQQLEARGMRATIFSAFWSHRGIRLYGVHLQRDGIRADIPMLDVTPTWRGNVARIFVAGTLGKKPQIVYQQVAQAETNARTQPGASQTLPTISVRDARVLVVDRLGTLVAMDDLSADVDGESANLHAAAIRVGERTSHAIRMEGVRIRALVSTRKLENVSIARWQSHLDAQIEGPNSITRLRAWEQNGTPETAVMPQDAEAPQDAETNENVAHPRLWQTIQDRLALRAHVQIDAFAVEETRGTNQTARLVGPLRITLARTGVDEFHTTAERADRDRDQQPRTTQTAEHEVAWNLVGNHTRLRGQLHITDMPLQAVAAFVPDIPWHEPERGRITLSATLRHAAEGETTLDGAFTIANAALFHPRIAPTPITGLNFSANGSFTVDPAARRVRIDRLTLQAVAADRATSTTVVVTGAAQRKSPAYAVDLHIDIPTTGCESLRNALPHGLLGELESARLTGDFAASMHIAFENTHLEDTILDMRFANRCRVIAVPAFADVARFRIPFTQTAVSQVTENGRVRTDSFSFETGPTSAAWTPITEINPFFVHAVLTHEDGGFFSHGGFSLRSMREALIDNLRAGRYVRGGSTISMQLVKNLLLHREKTLVRKLQEIVLTWWLESSLSKQELLELYFNVIEYGPHIYGIRAAAAHYFGREPRDLTLSESVFLANILPNPPRFHSHYERGQLSSSFVRQLQRFVAIMRERGRIDEDAERAGLNELTAFTFARPGEVRPPQIAEGHAAALPWATDGVTPQDEEWVENDWGDSNAEGGHEESGNEGDGPIDLSGAAPDSW